MNNKAILGLATVIMAVGLMLAGCGEAEQQQTKTPAATPQAKAQPKPQAKPQAEAYPIDFCVVSGEKLGAMGDPVDFNYNGRTVKLCCSGCLKTIKKNPAMYIAKLDSAIAGKTEATGHEGHNH